VKATTMSWFLGARNGTMGFTAIIPTRGCRTTYRKRGLFFLYAS
jgi:hypothetical protein